MKKFCIYITSLSFCFLLSSKSVVAETQPREVVEKFMQQILNNKSINSDVFDGVYIPEVKKDTPLGEYRIIPTPQRKDTLLLVAFIVVLVTPKEIYQFFYPLFSSLQQCLALLHLPFRLFLHHFFS
jgi:hypothetical protein